MGETPKTTLHRFITGLILSPNKTLESIYPKALSYLIDYGVERASRGNLSVSASPA